MFFIPLTIFSSCCFNTGMLMCQSTSLQSQRSGGQQIDSGPHADGVELHVLDVG